MDPTIFQSIQHFGALGILALIVYRGPAIIQVISDLIQKVMGTIRETQNEALAVFKEEQKNMVEMLERQLSPINQTLNKVVETLNEVKALKT